VGRGRGSFLQLMLTYFIDSPLAYKLRIKKAALNYIFNSAAKNNQWMQNRMISCGPKYEFLLILVLAIN